MTTTAAAPSGPAVGLPERGLRIIRGSLGPRMLRKWDVRERGQGYVPDEGPVIIAANHIGWLDGPLLFIRAPRRVHALVKEEEFAGRNARLLRAISQIRVARERVDTGAMRRASSALAAGQAIGIFPEGRRGDGELHEIKKGIAYLALVSGAPIVPLALFGTRDRGEGPDFRPAPGARNALVYGRPLRIDAQPWPRTTAAIDEAAVAIHEHLLVHLAWAKDAVKRDLPGPLPKGSFDV